MDDNEKFTIKKCPNCNGYGTFGYGKHVCITCKGKGVIIIDNLTGKLVDDYEGGLNESRNIIP
jgi:DnaJ-class molecular chaperone